jgi:hypothetical protein
LLGRCWSKDPAQRTFRDQEEGASTYHLLTAGHLDELVAFLVNQQLAVNALVPLAAETPDAIRAEGAESSL